jgi:hypothetical protein
VVKVVRPRENILEQTNKQFLVFFGCTLALNLIQSDQAQVRSNHCKRSGDRVVLIELLQLRNQRCDDERLLLVERIDNE